MERLWLESGTGLLFTPAVDWCSTFALSETVTFIAGQNYLGGTAKVDDASQGWLTAVDAATGTMKWRYRSPRPMVAAVTTTAGGLVLTGETAGDFVVFESATGRELYRFDTGASWAAASSRTTWRAGSTSPRRVGARGSLRVEWGADRVHFCSEAAVGLDRRPRRF